MSAVYVLLGAAVLALVLAFFLFFGKGGWLIAGYNTASEEEQNKYDKKKLCRAMSVLCTGVAVNLAVLAWFGYRVETGAMAENAMLPVGLVFAGLVLGLTFGVLIYIDHHCKK